MIRIAPAVLALALAAACTPARPTLPAAPPPSPAPVEEPHMEPVRVLTPVASPSEVGMVTSLPARLDALARAAVADSAASGIAIAVGRWGRLVHLRGYGAVDWAPGSASVTDSTLFDL